MLGTGVGDAVGRPLEGGPPLLVEEEPYFDGRYTDDTEMMIGVAESLIEVGGFDGEHMAKTFVKNYDPELDRLVRGYGAGPPMVFRMIERGGSGGMLPAGGCLAVRDRLVTVRR